ncbi:transglutaminase domain-containing protein [Nocardioides sp. MH1]|uniref:transglutaminase family protein n=1 Tax=Nocardioides sp. MH1 TaxID=3242490 RepID=UPI003522558C
MTSVAPSIGAPRSETGGRTTQRMSVWSSPTVRRSAVDLLALCVLFAAGVQAFGPVFGDATGYVSAGTGVLVGLAIAAVATWLGWSRLGTLLASMLCYLLLGGAVALPSTTTGGVLPSVETLQRLTLLSWQSWRDLLTVALPAGDFEGPAVLPWLVGLATATVAGSAVLRLRRIGWVLALGLLPPAALLVTGILWGGRAAPGAALQGAVFAVAALAWASWRTHVGAGAQRAVFVALPQHTRGPRLRQVATAATVLAVASGAGVGGWALLAPHPDRFVLRDHVQPPLDLQQYPSPLTQYRRLEADLEHKTLFTVSGMPAGARVRLAVMDVYDGNVYRVAAGTDGAAQGSGAFVHVGRTIEPSSYSDTEAPTSEVTFTIGAYDGIWLPGGGDLRGVDFSGDEGAGLHYNAATGSALTTTGVSAGTSYTVDGVFPPTYDAKEDLPASAQVDTTYPMPANTVRVEAVGKATGKLVGKATTPLQQLIGVEQNLQQGYYSNGTDIANPSFPGHSAGRIKELLDPETGQMIGDDEQYAVAMALVARDQGLPARVVMGFYPDPDKATSGPVAITGDDAHVWVEVLFKDIGWVNFDPTPDEDRTPEQNQPKPEPKHEPQVLPPPEVPDDHDLQAPPRKDSDEKNDDHGGDCGFCSVLRVAAIAAAALSVAVGPFVAIAWLKRRRRQRRRRAPRLADRISGGWAEVMDLATDVGIRVPPPATRFEAAMLLETRVPPSTTVPIARRVDAHVFGNDEPTEVDVEAVWSAVDALRSQFRQSATLGDRIRQRFSLRSLVRRPTRLARAGLRATTGGKG